MIYFAILILFPHTLSSGSIFYVMQAKNVQNILFLCQNLITFIQVCSLIEYKNGTFFSAETLLSAQKLLSPLEKNCIISPQLCHHCFSDVFSSDNFSIFKIESYAKKMLKMFWVLTVLFVNLMSSRLFPIFVYKICIRSPYYASLRHFSFQRYDGFSFKLIFQKIHKLEVIFEIFCCGKILFNKMSFNFAI